MMRYIIGQGPGCAAFVGVDRHPVAHLVTLATMSVVMPTGRERIAGPLGSAAAVFFEKLGMVVEEFSPERVVATMPVEGNTQPDGFLHGGATCSLVETVASMGGAAAAGWPARIVMGQQQSTHFLSTATDGNVRGVATPLRLGKTTHVWNVEVTHVETGRPVASGRVTLAVRAPKKPVGHVPSENRGEG